MTTVAYYPGCSLKSRARPCEVAGREAATALGIELVELERWNCCGTVFSMTAGDRMHHIASLRNLTRVQDSGHREVVTMCAMCHSSLRQVNELSREDGAALDTMNQFMDRESDYEGGVEVLHYLTLLDRLGKEALAERVVRPLTGLRVAPYYGCTLLRPACGAVDDAEDPDLMERLLEALGAEVVRDPMRVECCGAHLVVDRPEAVAVRVRAIHDSARAGGADVLATMCPLCFHNLDRGDDADGDDRLAVLYFTQLVALAVGVPPERWLDGGHRVDPRPLLRSLDLVEEASP